MQRMVIKLRSSPPKSHTSGKSSEEMQDRNDRERKREQARGAAGGKRGEGK
jgi:hypothetical protein